MSTRRDFMPPLPENLTAYEVPPSRKPHRCGETSKGHISRSLVGGQSVVYCDRCHLHWHNAPAEETGRERNTIRNRPGLKEGQRHRILMRDMGRCVLCQQSPPPGSSGEWLEVAHFVGVKEGEEFGATVEDLFDDENLFIACRECNRDQSWRSSNPRLWLVIKGAHFARIRRMRDER